VESSDSDSSEDEKRKKKKKKKKSKKSKRKKRKKRKRVESSDSDSDSDSDSQPPKKKTKILEEPKAEEVTEWVVRTDVGPPQGVGSSSESEGEDDIGPKLEVSAHHQTQALTERDYGDGMMPGEATAMANFVAMGKRIPRRGEVGMTSNEIQDLESLGYVMSGSRHKRMNAVRLRKETQIYSAEQKRALGALNVEARLNKEKRQIAEWQRMLDAQRTAR